MMTDACANVIHKAIKQRRGWGGRSHPRPPIATLGKRSGHFFPPLLMCHIVCHDEKGINMINNDEHDEEP